MRTINLGGTTLELIYLGKNHSNGNLITRLPKERIIFTVDWVRCRAFHFAGWLTGTCQTSRTA
jgi:flavorubredoxin